MTSAMRDVADLRQGGDMPVVEASTGAEDEDLEIVAPEDVDRHLRHVVFAPLRSGVPIRPASVSSSSPS